MKWAIQSSNIGILQPVFKKQNFSKNEVDFFTENWTALNVNSKLCVNDIVQFFIETVP